MTSSFKGSENSPASEVQHIHTTVWTTRCVYSQYSRSYPSINPTLYDFMIIW
jgi:hypothetical protein